MLNFSNFVKSLKSLKIRMLKKFTILMPLTSFYILCLSGCLFVCLYPMNVKTAKPIRSKFCVGPHMTQGKIYEWSKFQKLVLIKSDFQWILKIHENFFKICELLLPSPDFSYIFVCLVYSLISPELFLH